MGHFAVVGSGRRSLEAAICDREELKLEKLVWYNRVLHFTPIYYYIL